MKKSEIIAQLVTRVEALENAMIKPKSGENQLRIQPEVGKWYIVEHLQKVSQNAIAYCSDLGEGGKGNYGFDHQGNWMDGQKSSYGFSNVLRGLLRIVSEATDDQIEEALVKEATRRGIDYGVSVILVGGREQKLQHTHKKFYLSTNSLFIGNYLVFENGIWAEPIQEEPEPEQDKFAELKRAHSNGAVIQCRSKKYGAQWVLKTHEDFFDLFEYRIKPEEKPKVGDYVKAWYKSEDQFAVGVVKEIIDRGDFKFDIRLICYPGTSTSILYPNAKSLTKQEAISLLFGEVEKLVLPEIKKDGFLSDEECSYKIDIFKSSKEEGRVTIYKNKNYLTGKELISLLFGNEKTN